MSRSIPISIMDNCFGLSHTGVNDSYCEFQIKANVAHLHELEKICDNYLAHLHIGKDSVLRNMEED